MVAGKAKKATKKMTGKSAAKVDKAPEYKPSLWLDGKQVPSSLKDAKPGAKVTFTAVGKVIRTADDLGSGKSVSIELDKMTASPKKGKGK